jgi:cell division inhibitor SepF
MTSVWKKALIYLGLVEEEDDLEPLPEVHEPPPLESVRPIRPETDTSAVRKISSAPTIGSSPVVIAPPAVQVHVIEARSYDDAREIGERLKVDTPVIMNLQNVPREVAVKLLAFASGATHVLSGDIKPVADKVFLLTPPTVVVTAEETQRIISERGFFNQF